MSCSYVLFCRLGTFNQSPWAVKKINSKCASKQVGVFQRRLSDEAKILKGLHHPNIVGFRAFTTAKDGSKCLAMEYGGEQSLNDLIERRREEGLKAFPAATIDKVALHVARGLQVTSCSSFESSFHLVLIWNGLQGEEWRYCL